ncbi:MAG: N-acetylmuramoyl-L-alanine amidase [Rhodocyclales bacterium]|nr:N-acetylmuramoyl-L-alanine amidase [Rhodocyclales bacterium]
MKNGVKALLTLAALASAGAHGQPLVALDVGHSLARPGAISARGAPEFDFNLKLAQAIAAELGKGGVAVRLIGADGLADNPAERSPQAAGAQLLLSIHHDAVQPEYLRHWQHGGETRPYSDRFRGHALFISGRNPQEARSLHCAARIGGALRRAGFIPTRHHAEPIEGEARPWADYAAGVHYYDNLVVLKTAEVPAVLFEAGVIVNRREELLLAQEGRRARMAKAAARGILDCLPR